MSKNVYSNGNGRVDNRTFAATDTGFQEACKRAGIPPTQRQASKYRLGFGRAWDNREKNFMSDSLNRALDEFDNRLLTAAVK